MVEVFRTNVAEIAHADDIISILQKRFPGSRINFDLEDCDKVLRVEGKNFVTGNVIKLVEEKGYECCPLE